MDPSVLIQLPNPGNGRIVSATRPSSLWRAVLARAAAKELGEQCRQLRRGTARVEAEPEYYAQLLTRADDALSASGRRLLVLFDALDRLGGTIGCPFESDSGVAAVALLTNPFAASAQSSSYA